MNQHLERIDGLALFMQPSARALIEQCDVKLHRLLLVVYGYRDVKEQALLYQQGRTYNPETNDWDTTDPAKIVTRAKVSPHNVVTKIGGRASVAMDVIPLKDDGTPEWGVGEYFWDQLYELSWKVGLDPLGDPVGGYLKMDKGHFEEPGWKYKLDGLGLVLPG